MAHHLRAAIAHVKAHLRQGFRQQFPIDVDALARDVGHRWRERKLTPAATVALFLIQILHGNVAMTALRHLGPVAVDASSYCIARARLPLALFAALFDAVVAMNDDASSSSHATLLNGRRVLIADVTTFSTPDDPGLRRHFSYPPGPRQGCGFPVGRLLGVIDAFSGAVVAALGCPLFTHEAREMLQLHPLLKKRDILVADRGFCSYTQITLLLQRGVDSVMRLHQRRPTSWTKDHAEVWTRPSRRPQWMSEAVFSSLPPQLSVRIVRYTVPRKGCRSRVVYVATTLLDPIAYPASTIMRLYGHRWNIETCFNQLKTHAKMNALKSKSAAGITKELIMYLIVWNLVRRVMSRFAATRDVSVWRVSFLDTIRWLRVRLLPPQAAPLPLLINPDRPGRWEPRKLKRRMNEYDWLTEPRQSLKAKHHARYG